MTANSVQILGVWDMATYNGTVGNDVYTGGTASDLINGNDGNDVLSGLGGLDTINGGTGADTIDGGAGNDNLRGGADGDSISGGADNDMIYGEDGGDTIQGGDGSDFIDGGAGADSLSGGNGNDTLYVRGGQGGDVIDGGAGYDTLTLDLVSADLTAGVRADLVALSAWMSAPAGSITLANLGLTISGVEFLNLLVDGVNVDASALANAPPSAEAHVAISVVEEGSVSGQAAATDPEGGALSWSLLQGPSFGALAFDTASGSYTYTGANNFSGTDSFTVRITDSAGLSIDQVIDVTVTGVADAPVLAASGAAVALDATILGSVQDDDLAGKLGNDVILGSDGNDVIAGDVAGGMRSVPLDVTAVLTDVDGSETLSIRISGVPSGSSLSAGVLMADGSWSLTSADLAGLMLVTGETSDLVLGVEARSTEKDGDVAIVTTSIGVTFSEATGNDTIDGGAGNDTIDGGAGDDLIAQLVGSGFDQIEGGDGFDTVSITLGSEDLTSAARADFATLMAYLASHTDAPDDIATLSALGLSLHAVENVTVTLDGAQVDISSLLNTAPQAEPVVAIAAVEDTPLSAQLAAMDAEGDAMTWTLIEGPQHGTLQLDEATGQFVYAAAADYSGADSFLVNIADTSGASVEQRVEISVAAVANMPALSAAATAGAGSIAAAAANLAGTAGNDTLTGTVGNDLIEAGKGNDLVYGDGAATIVNGPIALDIQAALTDLDGSETLSILVSGLPVAAALSAGKANADGTWSLTPADLAGLSLTGPAGVSFTLTVAATATEQSGVSATVETSLALSFGAGSASGAGSGNDTIKAGSGNDTIHGCDGNDVVDAGSGNDVLYDGNGNDTVHGGDGNDVLTAGAGDDILRGGAGNDTVIAGLGHDKYAGGKGIDVLDLSAASTGLSIDVAGHTVSGGLDARIYGFESIVGSAQADVYAGSWKDDVFNAGAGNDVIRGRGGDDTMTGGAGRDTFAWTKKDVLFDCDDHGRNKGSLDVITDFGAGDKLDLHELFNLKGKPVTDFLKVKDNAWGTMVSVKLDGKFVDVVKLEGFHDNSVSHMIEQDMILI